MSNSAVVAATSGGSTSLSDEDTGEPSMYLRLFNGRRYWDEEMEDWGFEGPTFEVKGFVHGVYNAHLWVDHEGTGDGDELRYVGDCLYYDGKYYGDWTVFEASQVRGREVAVVPFDPEKARIPIGIPQTADALDPSNHPMDGAAASHGKC